MCHFHYVDTDQECHVTMMALRERLLKSRILLYLELELA